MKNESTYIISVEQRALKEIDQFPLIGNYFDSPIYICFN